MIHDKDTNEKSQELTTLLNRKPHWLVHRSGFVGLILFVGFILAFYLITNSTNLIVKGELYLDTSTHAGQIFLRVEKHRLDDVPADTDLSIRLSGSGKTMDISPCSLSNPTQDHVRYQIHCDKSIEKRLQEQVRDNVFKQTVRIRYTRSLLDYILN